MSSPVKETAAASCRPCQIRDRAHDDSVIYRDESWTAAVAMNVPGWVVLLTNRHHTDWLWGLSEQEAAGMGTLLRHLSAATRAATGAERVYCIGMGENSLHPHLLLVSRYKETPEEIRGPGIVSHAATLADPERAVQTAVRIREQLHRVATH